jgi:hypothetical protein
MDSDMIRRRLEGMKAKTQSASNQPPAGWWGSNNSDERRVKDDWDAGRVHWREAYENACSGLRYLDEGAIEMAEICMFQAIDFYIVALEIRVRPSDMDVLKKPAKMRGRPKKN